jgi:hypothetical protein
MNNNKQPYEKCIIKVLKKNKRSKFESPSIGTELYIVHSFTNSWGTEKLIGISQEGKEWWTTCNSVEFVKETEFDTKKAKKIARSEEAAECEILSKNTKGKQWIATRMLRSAEGKELTGTDLGKSLNTYTEVYVSLWYAKKIGLLSK